MANTLLTRSDKEYYEYLVEQQQKGLLDESSIKLLKAAGYLPSEEERSDKKKLEKENYSSWAKEDLFELTVAKFSAKNYPNPVKEKWIPKSITKHTLDFYKWIDAITYGFFDTVIKTVSYEKYEWYKAQAIQWFYENKSHTHYSTVEKKYENIQDELERCRQNTLYFAMKYCYVKEGNESAGRIEYVPKEHNMFIFYLLDCGYSIYIGKPRQIFASTTMGLYALKKILLQSNFFMKFIAEDADTVEEIFRDKIKYPFAELPTWLKPNVISDSAESFWLGEKIKKGEIDEPNSRISIVPPSRTAINGGSPQLVFIDEAASIPILAEMILEALPTMFVDKNQDGNLEMKRQLVCWTTGVSGVKGKNAWEHEWRRILGLWEERNGSVGIIPIFLSWHCRCDLKHYNEQMAIYFGGKNLTQTGAFDVETNKKIFYQHYPSSFNDMFLITANTLVPKSLIDEGKASVRNLAHNLQPVPGYFEPVYEITKPSGEFADIPYKIIDANFIPCNDDEVYLATAWRLIPPNHEYIDRYYQGTDPISETSGHSNFSSTIWDKLIESEQKDVMGRLEYKVIKPKTPVCILNFRKQHDPNYCFLQSVLMGLYYDTNNMANNKQGIPELIEANIGTNYCGFKERLGFAKNLVYNSQLPDKLRGGARIIGVDNKVPRFSEVINKMRECIKENYLAFKFHVIFEQLQTFVEKPKSKDFTYEALDKKIHFDDVLFSLTYAYICAEYCFDHKTPKKIVDYKKEKIRLAYPLMRDGNGMLYRTPQVITARV